MVATLLALVVTGCGGLGPGYLKQAAQGQWALLQGRRPLAEVMVDPNVPARTKALLDEVADVKRFGEGRGLRPTENYTEYVEVDGPAVVWVVSACAPLSFTAREWSFPVVGSFTYVGWFDKDDAEAHGAQLRREGYDAFVRGSVAFSTLGWFRDPIVSTMIPEGEIAPGELFDTVLHESVHATFYINSQSYLNESVASFAARKLAAEYLIMSRGREAVELRAYLLAEAATARRNERLRETYHQLASLYASRLSDDAKRREKQRILRATQKALGMSRALDNAMLIQFRTYGVGEAEYEALLEACEGNWSRFFAALRTLTASSFSRPQQETIGPVLRALADRGCKAP